MSTAIRVLHVISNLHAGGAEKMVVTAANIFVDKGHQADVALLIEKGSHSFLLDERVGVHLLNRKWRFDLKSLRALSRLANGYDVVHVHLKHNIKFVFVANLIWRITAPIILHDHSAEVLISHVQKTRLPFFITHWLRNQTYVGVSSTLREWAIINFKLRPERCFTLPNAIPVLRKREEVRERRNDGVLRLVLVSNFRRIKNIQFAVTVVKALSERNVNVALDIFGQPLDKPYFQEITEMIQRLSLSDRILINTGVTDVPSLLTRYDLALHCANAETGPLVLLEYLGSDLPFVSIRRGEVAEEVAAKFPEFVLDNFSIPEWVDRILQVKKDRLTYHETLVNFFKSTFSTENYYEKLCFIYGKTLTY